MVTTRAGTTTKTGTTTGSKPVPGLAAGLALLLAGLLRRRLPRA